MTERLPDLACIDLAEMYLVDEPALASRCNELAHYIQCAIEEWIAAQKAEHGGHA